MSENQPEYDFNDFRSWLHGIVVVAFDQELGQVINNVYPVTNNSQDELTEQDRTNICYFAFPDSNSGIMGDTQFHFRIRRVGSRTDKQYDQYNSCVLPALQVDPNFLFGFAYFRQVKDPTIRRGYYQKSVILLAYLPLITSFTQLTTHVARKFFE